MDVTFRKLPGHPPLGILFFWSLKITPEWPSALSDYFIPETFYDYVFIRRGQVTRVDLAGNAELRLRRQTLKGPFTRPFRLNYLIQDAGFSPVETEQMPFPCFPAGVGFVSAYNSLYEHAVKRAALEVFVKEKDKRQDVAEGARVRLKRDCQRIL